MPMNVGSAITPAMEHTSRLLFKPFAMRKWLALGFVSILAGGGGGGVHFNTPSDSKSSDIPGFPSYHEIQHQVLGWVMGHLTLIILGFVALFLASLILSWLGAVFKFIYVNQVTRKPIAIKEPFDQFLALGTSFFLWQLAFSLVVVLVLAFLVGLPLAGAFLGHAGTAAQAVAVVWSVAVGSIILLLSSAVNIFAEDFVLTAMFVRGIRVMEAWRIIIPIIKENLGQSILYILLLIVIGIVSAIGGMFAGLAVGLVFILPGGLLALIGAGIYAASGDHWSPALIAYASTFGLALLLALVYALQCAVQPFLVFRKAYALAVLGQADSSLATIPLPPTNGPRLMPEHGV